MAVVQRLAPGILRLGTPCTRLEAAGQGFAVNGERFDRVVSTLPLKVLQGVWSEDRPKAVHDAFQALDHTSLMTVFLALDKPNVPPHSWLYFPHDHQGPQNRITYLSNYSPKNAPPGKSSIMAEVTYYKTPPGSDDQVVQEVVNGLASCGLLAPHEVRFAKVWHNRFAYILYRHGLEDALSVLRQHCQHKGLDIIGRFGNYNYYNSDMCIRAAMDLARAKY